MNTDQINKNLLAIVVDLCCKMHLEATQLKKKKKKKLL